MNYEEFFTDEEVATYKRVKKGSMMLGHISRQIAAEMVGGQIPWEGKEFVQTELGTYRLCSRANSDNTTEQLAHDRMGAKTVVMDEDGIREFFAEHGLRNGIGKFKHRVRVRVTARLAVGS